MACEVLGEQGEEASQVSPKKRVKQKKYRELGTQKSPKKQKPNPKDLKDPKGSKDPKGLKDAPSAVQLVDSSLFIVSSKSNTGYFGVTKSHRGGYEARCNLNYLGRHATVEEAASAVFMEKRRQEDEKMKSLPGGDDDNDETILNFSQLGWHCRLDLHPAHDLSNSTLEEESKSYSGRVEEAQHSSTGAKMSGNKPMLPVSGAVATDEAQGSMPNCFVSIAQAVVPTEPMTSQTSQNMGGPSNDSLDSLKRKRHSETVTEVREEASQPQVNVKALETVTDVSFEVNPVNSTNSKVFFDSVNSTNSTAPLCTREAVIDKAESTNGQTSSILSSKHSEHQDQRRQIQVSAALSHGT